MLNTQLQTASVANAFAGFEKTRLSTGTTLLFNALPEAPRLTLCFFIPGGNHLDPVLGMSDLIDRLLMKGTDKRSAEQIAIDIDSLTLELSSDTKRDYSILFATMLEEDLEASLELISDLFFNATMDEFEREREKMIGEIHMDLDAPKTRASDQFIRELFWDTPYNAVGSVLLETLPQIENVELLRVQYRQLYRPDRLVISAAGNVDTARLTQLLETYFPDEATSGAASSTAVKTLIQNQNISENKLVTFTRDDSAQAHIFKGWLIPDITHPDTYAMMVMNTILGGAGLSSRMFVELRDKQGLAYNVRSSLDFYQYRGVMSLYIGTEPNNVQKCLDGFSVECQKLVDIPVSEAELKDAKDNLLGRRSVMLETGPQLASYVGSNYILGRPLEVIAQIPDKIRAITVEDVQRVAREIFTRPALVSIAGPSFCLPKS